MYALIFNDLSLCEASWGVCSVHLTVKGIFALSEVICIAYQHNNFSPTAGNCQHAVL